MNRLEVGERRMLIPGNDIDVGLIVRKNRNGFVAVTLGMGADPDVFTPELVASERAQLPRWRFEKEYLRRWDAQDGQPVFQADWVARQAGQVLNPIRVMDVRAVLHEQTLEPVRDMLGHVKLELVETAGGRLRVFLPPDAPPPVMPAGAAHVVRSVGIGVDVSEGVGASDSAFSVRFADTMEQAAAFNCNQIHPGELGRLLAVVARYYNDALVCPVRKMHGITTIRAMIDAGYTNIWHTQNDKTLVPRSAADLGWPKGESSDPVLFGQYADALESDTIILHDAETVAQLSQYVYDATGRIVMTHLRELNVAARHRHGDLVVADALSYRACMDMPKLAKVVNARAPSGSHAALREQFGPKPKEWKI